MKNYFGQNLRHIRLSKSMKLNEITDLTGIKSTTWNTYELGKSFPNFSDLMRISEIVGISETDLIHKNLSNSNDFSVQSIVAEEAVPYNKPVDITAVLYENISLLKEQNAYLKAEIQFKNKEIREFKQLTYDVINKMQKFEQLLTHHTELAEEENIQIDKLIEIINKGEILTKIIS